MPASQRKRFTIKKAFFFLILAAAIGLALTPEGRETISGIAQVTPLEKPKIPRPQTPTGFLTVNNANVDIFIDALGTVTPLQTVTVRSRVEGELMKLNFREGAIVQQGQIIAELDSRPYEAALMQVEGQFAKNKALLDNAKRDLERYQALLKENAIASQEVDTQAALKNQYEAAILSDKGNVDAAKLELDYTRIKSPLTGRVGLRQRDIGNIIRPSDAEGIVTITQEDPISVIFSVPSQHLTDLTGPVRSGKKLVVEAWNRENTNKIADGVLKTIDNAVDPGSDMLKLRAVFDNPEGLLFPNQFVNIKLKIDTLENTPLVRDISIRLGTSGTFVYIITDEGKAEMRPVTTGPTQGNMVAILNGVKAGEKVAIDGLDRLRDGIAVIPIDREAQAQAKSTEAPLADAAR